MDAVIVALVVGLLGVFGIFVMWDVARRRVDSAERMHAAGLADKALVGALVERVRELESWRMAQQTGQAFRSTRGAVSLESSMAR